VVLHLLLEVLALMSSDLELKALINIQNTLRKINLNINKFIALNLLLNLMMKMTIKNFCLTNQGGLKS